MFRWYSHCFFFPVTHFLILMAAIDGENVLAKNGIFEGTSGLLWAEARLGGTSLHQYGYLVNETRYFNESILSNDFVPILFELFYWIPSMAFDLIESLYIMSYLWLHQISKTKNMWKRIKISSSNPLRTSTCIFSASNHPIFF